MKMNLFTSLLILVILSTERLFSARSMKVELIHRDAASGGFSGAVEEKLRALHHRDVTRSLLLQRRRISVSASSVEMPINSGADYGTGEYFVRVRVGSPGQKFMLVADTGSDLTWINCRYRCGRKCGIHKGRVKQRRVFMADRSSSFRTVPCQSDMCKIDLSSLFSLTTCPTPLTPCAYDYRYLEDSSAIGFFANETISVGLTNGRKKKLKNVVIGCTESTRGDQSGFKGSDGILGLGFSPNAFTARAGARFSYCLVDHLSPRNVSNFIVFGHDRVESSAMQSTQLILVGPLYGVAVAGISIGGQTLEIPAMAWDPSRGGGAVLDSGTSLTFLTEAAYGPVTASLRKFTQKQAVIDDGGPFEFCFNSSGFEEAFAPRLRVHFADGAVFQPPVKSYIIDVAPAKKCLGFVSLAWPATSVIGNILQQNHLWVFDLDQRKLGFAPSSCT